MPVALIEIAFDPVLRFGDLDIRWQSVGLTVAFLIALGLAARIGSYLPPRVPSFAGPQYPDAPAVGTSAPATELPTAQRLRLDDLAYIVLGIVPGAVVGGRVVHAIVFWDAYAADPGRLLDAGVGTLSLLGAVVGGALTGGYVASLLATSVRRWADALALPLLLALGLGKLAQLLGGSGQGAAFDGGWAVAFSGAGPWHGLSPELAAHPSQIYEGLWVLIGIPLLLRLVGSGPDLWRALPAWLAPRRPTPPTPGLLFFTALAWFLAGRVVVGFTWRDAAVAGPLNGEQAVALAILFGVLVGVAVRGARPSTSSRAIALGLAVLVGAALPASAAASPADGRLDRPAPAAADYSARVEAVLASMTLDEKVGQLFVSRVYGDEAAERDAGPVGRNRKQLGVDNAVGLIATYHVGGIIYFGWAGNVATPTKAARLSNGIQAAAMGGPRPIPLLISTDQEGGTIVRLKAPATAFAGNMAIGATRRADLARAAGRVIGTELRAVGINQALAPVADVNNNPANPVIGVRSYGSRAGLVADMAAAQVLGLQVNGGVAATVKHFPGHGDTHLDSHSGLPVIDISRAEWQRVHAPPFAAAIASGVEVVMTAHVAVPSLDPSGRPATLSQPMLTDVLRGDLGFDGVIMTDSLGMAGVNSSYGRERVPVLALLAGADILLNPPRIAVAYQAVLDALARGELTEARIDSSVRRILRLKERLGLFDSQQVDVSAVGAVVGAAEHRAVERAVAEASVTLVRNDGGVLPLAGTARVFVTGWGSAALANLRAALAAGGISSTALLTGTSPGSGLIQRAAERAASHSVVIVVTANADAYRAQRRLVKALVATGRRVITIAVRRPYDSAWYAAAVHLCLYSWSAPSMAAAVRVIYGKLSPAGRLPVAIRRPGEPVRFEFGFGLGY